MNKDKIVKHLNSIIETSIIHGGDSGGAYFINGKDLVYAIKNAMNFFELAEYKLDYNYPEYEENPTYDDATWIQIIKKKKGE